jgi:hypothetical protein
MEKAGWTVKILVRYILLQVPGTALLVFILIQLRNWFDLPVWSVWGLIAISVAKDVILFPFVWSAYDWDRQEEAHPMVGRREERGQPSKIEISLFTRLLIFLFSFITSLSLCLPCSLPAPSS